MNFKCSFRVKQFEDGKNYLFFSEVPDEFSTAAGAIQEAFEMRNGENLIELINKAKESTEQIYYSYLWLNVYKIELVNKNNNKMFYICNVLMKGAGEPYDECYISVEDFKEILEIWVKEKNKFEQDPEEYKKNLKKGGGIVEEVNRL